MHYHEVSFSLLYVAVHLCNEIDLPRARLYEAAMLKRTTQLLQDNDEIHISLLEESE